MTTPSALRKFEVRAQSVETFGRVLCSSRDQHFVADGPVSNGCPGEALSPVELFLSGVASCGVELIQVLARNRNIPLTAVHTTIQGDLSDRRAASPDVALFSAVRMQFTFRGVTPEQGDTLIEGFKRR
jgi:uncharacterized OsmC-like protein